jgi:hypothetical protein
MRLRAAVPREQWQATRSGTGDDYNSAAQRGWTRPEIAEAGRRQLGVAHGVSDRKRQVSGLNSHKGEVGL